MSKRRHLIASVALAATYFNLPSVAMGSHRAVRLLSANYQAVNTNLISGLICSSDWEFSLSEEFMKLLYSGITLNFLTEFSLAKNHWLWRKRTLFINRMTIKLSFNPLSQIWSVNREGIVQTFSSYDQAIQTIKHLRGWQISDQSLPDSRQNLIAQIRLCIDSRTLPKPLLLNLGNNSALTFDSGWNEIH